MSYHAMSDYSLGAHLRAAGYGCTMRDVLAMTAAGILTTDEARDLLYGAAPLEPGPVRLAIRQLSAAELMER